MTTTSDSEKYPTPDDSPILLTHPEWGMSVLTWEEYSGSLTWVARSPYLATVWHHASELYSMIDAEGATWRSLRERAPTIHVIESTERRSILAALVGVDPIKCTLRTVDGQLQLVPTDNPDHVLVEFPRGWQYGGVWQRLLALDEVQHVAAGAPTRHALADEIRELKTQLRDAQ